MVKISAFVTAVCPSLPHPHRTKAEAASGDTTSKTDRKATSRPWLHPRVELPRGTCLQQTLLRQLTGRDAFAKMPPLHLNTQIGLSLSVLLRSQTVLLRNGCFPLHPDVCLAAPAKLFFVLQICLTYCIYLVCTFIYLPASIAL